MQFFAFGGEVRRPRGERRRGGEPAVVGEQRREGEQADAVGAGGEEVAAGLERGGVHGGGGSGEG